MSKKTPLILATLAIVCAAILVLISVGCGGGGGNKPADARPVQVGVAELGTAYFADSNVAAADAKYLNKLVEMDVTVGEIGFVHMPKKNAAGLYYIEFSPGIGWVEAVFKPSENAKVSAFTITGNGQRIVIRGICAGLNGNVVTVREAEFR